MILCVHCFSFLCYCDATLLWPSFETIVKFLLLQKVYIRFYWDVEQRAGVRSWSTGRSLKLNVSHLVMFVLLFLVAVLTVESGYLLSSVWLIPHIFYLLFVKLLSLCHCACQNCCEWEFKLFKRCLLFVCSAKFVRFAKKKKVNNSCENLLWLVSFCHFLLSDAI